MNDSRRAFIKKGLTSAGLLGLKSLATGLPLAAIVRPRSAWGQSGTGKYLILSAAQAGDPLNANAPGSYVEGPVHTNSELLAPRTIRLGEQQVQAALPWSTLPQDVLDQACFFHHGTYTNAHGNHPKVMRLMGAMNRNEMLVSMFARELSEPLGTVQPEPVNVGAPTLTYEGRRLGGLKPRALKDALVKGDDTLAQLGSLRDRELDRIYATLKSDGTPEQRQTLDRLARSRNEARSLSDALLNRLDSIDGDGEGGQVTAAAVLVAMNVSPVVALQLRFGRDNHTDGGLANEIEQTQQGVDHIRSLFVQLADLGMRDKVIFGSLNVFGRTLAKKGTNGRDHNAHHHVFVMIGPGLKAGVVGGIAPKGGDYGSMAIDSRTGRGAEDGDIAYEDNFTSAAKTLGSALGLSNEVLDREILGGKPVSAALDAA